METQTFGIVWEAIPCLFQPNGLICMNWENCSKKGEDCPFHDCYIRLSTSHCNFKAVCFQFMTDPKQKGSIQEIIDQNMEPLKFCAWEMKDTV